MKQTNVKILAIESSCDETSAAIIEVNKSYKKLITVNNSYKTQPILTNINHLQPLLTMCSNIVSSQVKLHAKYGGVYPELASREHVRNIIPVIESALSYKAVSNRDSKKHKAYSLKLLADIDYLAVTTGPGLIGSLLVGVNTAKTMAYTLKKPIYSINHLEGHIYSNFVRESSKFKVQSSKLPEFPLIALIVSGGHTSLVYMKNHLDYKVIGETLDDAAGEAFDKVAHLLDLGYPGGPVISQMAEKVNIGYKKLKKVKKSYESVTIVNHLQPLLTNINQVRFPRPMINSNDFDFSFSGLKTSVLYAVKKLPKPLNNNTKALICKEFQDAAIETLVSKTIRAAKKYKVKSVLLCGGVASNESLRNLLKVECYKLKVDFFVPTKNLCTDNAGMIGIATAYKIALGKKPTPWYDVNADSNMHLS